MTSPHEGPIPSPAPNIQGASERPSGSHNVATIREALAIADQVVEPLQEKTEEVAKATKWQWLGLGFLGAVTVAVGGFVAWGLAFLVSIGSAQAQTQATAERALEAAKVAGARIETVDAGSRVAIERLTQDLANERANTDKKLTDMQITLQAILREAKKK